MKPAQRKISPLSEKLTARKNHLTALLTVIDTKPTKSTTIQKLTMNAIKAEIIFLDTKLEKLK